MTHHPLTSDGDNRCRNCVFVEEGDTIPMGTPEDTFTRGRCCIRLPDYVRESENPRAREILDIDRAVCDLHKRKPTEQP